MSAIEELRDLTHDMDTPSFLRFLIMERFPSKTLVTCSLRARSIVLLKLVSEIDPTTPIVFCHAQSPFPESLAYRANLVRRLGLRNVADPAEEVGAPLPGDRDHSEGLWAENPSDHTRAYRTIYLDRSLKGFDCWISGVYHGPYLETPSPRVTEEGRLIRVNPLASWTRDQVRGYMRENDLPYHPRSALRPRESNESSAAAAHIHHY